MLFIYINTLYANTNIIYNAPINNDKNTGPGVVDNTPKSAMDIKDFVVDGGEHGYIYTHQDRRYVKGPLIGKFYLTGYCSCTKCTKGTGITYSGKPVQAGHTVAADLTCIPLNTFILLEGCDGPNATDYDGIYQVEDIGGKVKNRHIDIYQPTHEEAGDVTKSGYNYSNVYLAVPVDDENYLRQLDFKNLLDENK